MNQEQRQAYEWAKNQDYQSVAARYAKILAGLINEMNAPSVVRRSYDGRGRADGDGEIGGAACKRHLSVAKVANVSNAVGVELGATAATTSMEQTQAGAPIARCMRVARNWPQ